MSKLFVPITPAVLDWHHELPFSTQYNDLYYSEHGLEQSRHVFIDGNHLLGRWGLLPEKSNASFNVAEIGFGTGLNFLLTWMLWLEHAPKEACLHFFSCEKNPLTCTDLIRCLSHWAQLSAVSGQLIEQYPVLTPGFHTLSFNSGRVKLTLMLGEAFECFEQLLICAESKLESQLRTTFIDAWFLNAFPLEKNAAMWSDALGQVIAMLSTEGTTLATYSTAEQVKTVLTAQGFVFKQDKGLGSKGHMMTASFATNSSKTGFGRSIPRHTPWHYATPSPMPEKKAIIIGAGLAGCYTAYALARRGWKVTVIEEQEKVGTGASGNQAAILFPKISAHQSPLTQLMLCAFLYASAFYKTIVSTEGLGELNGALLLAYNEKEYLEQARLKQWLMAYPELGELVEAQQASTLSGIDLGTSGLYIPCSGWINSPALCQWLSKTPGVSVMTNQGVDRLIQQGNMWQVNAMESAVVILANGHQLNRLIPGDPLPIRPVSGQMTLISETQASASLKIPLCGEGHVLPALGGLHHVGATYNSHAEDSSSQTADDRINLSTLLKIAPQVQWSNKAVDHWAGIRASTPDYLPLVGPIPRTDAFMTLFSSFESDSKRWISSSGTYYPGLYAFAGFGSRGLTTIPLCAEWLAASINHEISPLPRALIQTIAPARFLRREIIRRPIKS